MTFDFLSGMCALLAMVATVAARLVTTRLVGVARRRIKNVADRRLELLNLHRAAEATRRTADANLASLVKKKTKLEGKRSRLRDEVDALAAESESRSRQREARSALVRS
jgi:hypothetical protein